MCYRNQSTVLYHIYYPVRVELLPVRTYSTARTYSTVEFVASEEYKGRSPRPSPAHLQYVPVEYPGTVHTYVTGTVLCTMRRVRRRLSPSNRVLCGRELRVSLLVTGVCPACSLHLASIVRLPRNGIWDLRVQAQIINLIIRVQQTREFCSLFVLSITRFVLASFSVCFRLHQCQTSLYLMQRSFSSMHIEPWDKRNQSV